MNREELRKVNWWAAIACCACALLVFNVPFGVEYYERPQIEREFFRMTNDLLGYFWVVIGTLLWIAYCITAKD